MNIIGSLTKGVRGAAKTVGPVTNAVGGVAIEVGRRGLDTTYYALNASKRILFESADNALGVKPRKTAVIGGAIGLPLIAGGIGFTGGRRDAKLGSVDANSMTGMTPSGETAGSPNLRNLRTKPHFHDNLGADGQLALSLHQLRRG